MSDRGRDDELVDALRRLPREIAPPSHVAAAVAAAEDCPGECIFLEDVEVPALPADP